MSLFYVFVFGSNLIFIKKYLFLLDNNFPLNLNHPNIIFNAKVHTNVTHLIIIQQKKKLKQIHEQKYNFPLKALSTKNFPTYMYIIWENPFYMYMKTLQKCNTWLKLYHAILHVNLN